jgi:phosphoribosylformimino-5-aminoimidazole carboxamide ribotide isomerase
MIVIPAIDLLDGKCVRLLKGNYENNTIYSERPEEVARHFEEAGAQWIHLVDLNAARGKGEHNREVIQKIRDSVSCSLEVGGGIRDEEDVEELLEIGIDKLVLGTMLVKSPRLAAKWCERFGSLFVAGIDALNGEIRISGWEDGSRLKDIDFVKELADLGLTGIIYTNISRDGTLTGPDLEHTNLIAEHSALPVILSGGISSAMDVKTVFEKRHPNLKGVIIGKAIYENKLSLEELIDEYQMPYETPSNTDW